MIGWNALGFEKHVDGEDYWYTHHFAPMIEWNELSGFLYLTVNDEYIISKGKIPATDIRVRLLLDAFTPQTK